MGDAKLVRRLLHRRLILLRELRMRDRPAVAFKTFSDVYYNLVNRRAQLHTARFLGASRTKGTRFPFGCPYGWGRLKCANAAIRLELVCPGEQLGPPGCIAHGHSTLASEDVGRRRQKERRLDVGRLAPAFTR